ncbi:MAG: hypothetical protein OEN56_10265 [Gemmatimonadota bacterium]|nr:hypothetical protein [Gemmatimonadota bacterium]
MAKGTMAPTGLAPILGLLVVFGAACEAVEQDVGAAVATSPAASPSTSPTSPAVSPTTGAAAHAGLLYGRITTDDGEVYEGRLRWAGDEEALWSNYFNGFKDDNPWVAHAPLDQLPTERLSIELFGLEIIGWERRFDLGRPFMARFGDIALIEPRGRRLRVTLKSGTVFDLDRFAADDVADGVRVWDRTRGVVDLGEWGIRTIEFLPAATLGDVPYPLYGTVRTRQGDFTGLVQWDREACLGSDELHGLTPEGEATVRFDRIHSIERRSEDSSLVTLLDGRQIVLSGTRQVGLGNRGVYVDDPRYGRVLVSWDAFERLDFSPGGAGPAYRDFPAGRPLEGSVTARSGRRLTGRLVYDLDESETTETLDAPAHGVDYTIPFSLVASIALPDLDGRGAQPATVTLHHGEELQLELAGDLSERNAGMLVFSEGGSQPEYVPWSDVETVDFDRPLR